MTNPERVAVQAAVLDALRPFADADRIWPGTPLAELRLGTAARAKAARTLERDLKIALG